MRDCDPRDQRVTIMVITCMREIYIRGPRSGIMIVTPVVKRVIEPGSFQLTGKIPSTV